MPIVDTGDGSFDANAQAVEDAKIEQAKADLVDESGAGEGELILGKYGSAEELANAYQSLQREYSKLKGEQPEPQAEAPQQESEPEPQKQQPVQVSDPGRTDEESMEVAQAVFQQTGGQAKYQALASWAAQNLGDEVLENYNRVLNTGSVSDVLSAVKGLQFDYMMATGYEPRLSGGRAPASDGPKGFESEAQVVAAMSDPRYQSGPQQDPAYIKEVEARLRASNVFSGR